MFWGDLESGADSALTPNPQATSRRPTQLGLKSEHFIKFHALSNMIIGNNYWLILNMSFDSADAVVRIDILIYY